MKRALPVSAILTPAILALAALTACSGGGDNATRRPRPGLGTTTSSTEPIDLTSVDLRAVRGSTTSTFPTEPGAASISGQVRDAGGQSIGGATVVATWYTVDPPAEQIVTAGPDGSYSFAAIHGGRWRVRAYRIPDWATPKSTSFFLRADEQQDLNLIVDVLKDFEVTAAISPDPPPAGDEAQLAIRVGRRSLDSGGRIRSDPAAGISVMILNPSDWSIPSSGSTRTTGFDGIARWTVSCESEGIQRLEVRVEGKTLTPTLPACAPGIAPTTTSTVPTTTTII